MNVDASGRRKAGTTVRSERSGSEETRARREALLAELERLERDELQVSNLRRKLHERLASFPNELTEAREREMSRQRRRLHDRISAVKAELAELDGA